MPKFNFHEWEREVDGMRQPIKTRSTSSRRPAVGRPGPRGPSNMAKTELHVSTCREHEVVGYLLTSFDVAAVSLGYTSLVRCPIWLTPVA